MTRTALLRSWFVAPPLDTKGAIIWFLVALPVAALIRTAMGCGDMVGECCAPLFVFVLLSAVLLGWAGAVLATMASLLASVLLWSGQAHHHMQGSGSEIWAAGLFILYCALAVGAVEFTRRTVVRFSRTGESQERSSGIIFSLERGQAWASWPGSPSPVRLGPQDEVAAMMQDFVAQVEFSKNLQSLATAAGR